MAFEKHIIWAKNKGTIMKLMTFLWKIKQRLCSMS